MNARSEVIIEPRPVMEVITEEGYERGVIIDHEMKREAITITVNDFDGVTHIQEVIHFNPSVFSNEVSNPIRVETTEKELNNGSREIVEMVENNHTSITKESSDKGSLEMVAIDMDGQETRITWRGIITRERKKSDESMH
ncbi:hypothetical protein BCON_0037g00600 [Botryotinia convoluta]|uniref:Uncharacterized protein n=1 Tax=Botryotinia convoluta TaxID=54673 RepID=A0A4Z1IF57_9HELO|nr:hypothetical protein BCON_0037g00600 [Botryotinia convoluta]